MMYLVAVHPVVEHVEFLADGGDGLSGGRLFGPNEWIGHKGDVLSGDQGVNPEQPHGRRPRR